MILDKQKSYGFLREWLKNYNRDSYWSKERKLHLLLSPTCEVCGTDKNIQVHHIYPVRWFPKLELYHPNFITLCIKHHFAYGHFKNWKNWNPMVREMAEVHKKGYERFEILYDKYAIREESINHKRISKELKRNARKSYDIRR